MLLTDRVLRLKDRTLDWRPWQDVYLGQRLYRALESLDATRGAPVGERMALMLENIIVNHLPHLHPDELIVGYIYHGDDTLAGCETYYTWLKDPAERAKYFERLRTSALTPEQLERLDVWLGDIDAITKQDAPSKPLPQAALDASAENVIWHNGRIDNHNILAFDDIIKHGYEGLGERFRAQRDSCEPGTEKHAQLENFITICDAAAGLGDIYRGYAVLSLQPSPDRDALCDMLAQVPRRGARTFREAVQALWFGHVVSCWEDGINANGFGLIDRVLYPYYKDDIESGLITRQDAFEMICCLWMKIYRDYEVQQVTLGGVFPDGSGAVTDLTRLMLEVTDELDILKDLSVRVYDGMPEDFFDKSVRLLSKGRGFPFFFNDSTVIPSLVRNGVSLEDARGYAAIGCIELSIPGKSHTHPVGGMINVLKCLELALNNGVSLTTGKQIGPQTGNVSSFTSMDDLKAAYTVQVDYFIGLMRDALSAGEGNCRGSWATPYKAMLTRGCAESGVDYNSGGALYDHHQTMVWGLPNLADSFAVLEKFVFTEGKYTLGQVAEALSNDYPDERMRQEFILRAPKYGNDDDRVDKHAVWALDKVCDTLESLRDDHGGRFTAQPFTFQWLIHGGWTTGATPDGRRKGEHLAYSVSAMQGRDSSGFTALLNSIAKLPHDRCAGSTSAIVEADPALFSDANIERMVQTVRAAFDAGVGQLQVNVTNVETLRDAQVHPELHRNLLVRVTGYSQAFIFLPAELQEHVISRTKHKTA